MSDKPETNPTGLALLRVPFVEHQISQLPKPMKKREEMDKLPKANCKICGGYHATSMMMHLPYVGHAALTDRLLDADPNWFWEPMALDAVGYPAIDKDGGMWIKLTVCGVTRLGYGDAQGKSGGDAMKERIGDALRNAAMRFGAALDLWHKGDLHLADPDDEAGRKKADKDKGQKTEQPEHKTAADLSEDQKTYFPRIKSALDTLHGTDVAAKKATVKANSAIPAKGTYSAWEGIEDYRTLDSQRLKIVCHNIEKLLPKEATMCNECRQTGSHAESCPNALPPQ